MLGCCLAHLFLQDCAFFLPEPANDHFHAANVQLDPIILSSVLPAPPVSSPCLDANEKIDLQETGSPGCWSFHFCQTNQIWGGEPSELLVAEGYWIAVRAKPLLVVNETFGSVPVESSNCCYLDRLTFEASTARSKPAKRGSSGGVMAASLMIKSVKG